MSLPETHMVVRILRGLIDVEDMPITLITETNVPHEENVSYFGEGNEAHLVYQFGLAPLLLFSYLTGEAQALVDWTQESRRRPRAAAISILSPHDGIGLRPLEGLLPEAEIGRLIDIIHDRGGFASMRSTPSGEERAYELNMRCFLPLAVTMKASTPMSTSIADGLPRRAGFLFERLWAEPMIINMEMTGRTRSINRGSWSLEALQEALGNPASHHTKIFSD